MRHFGFVEGPKFGKQRTYEAKRPDRVETSKAEKQLEAASGCLRVTNKKCFA